MQQLPFYSEDVQQALVTCKVNRAAVVTGQSNSSDHFLQLWKKQLLCGNNDIFTKINTEEKKRALLKCFERTASQRNAFGC